MKRILFLAPQPFFQDRGTPIAVRMAVETLAAVGEFEIDLLTYHEGFDVTIENVTHLRMWAPRWLYGIRPGISIKKLLADICFFFFTARLLLKNRYDVIHAVEESVYMALPFAKLKKIPLIYDMDSSLSDQLTESWSILKPLAKVFRFLEGIAIKSCSGVLVVCNALKIVATEFQAPYIECLYDVSLLAEQSTPTKENLRETLMVPPETKLIMYIGNLESYQGIDLLLASTEALIKKTEHPFHVIILGGATRHIEKYANIAKKLGIQPHLSLLGPRSLSMLASYLQQATVLVSPRIKGSNTPLKLYSYLDSGTPIVATKLPTHTQVIDDSHAFLAEATSADFSDNLAAALNDDKTARAKAIAAKNLVAERYNRAVFDRTLIQFYKNIKGM